jgi:penicillin G amidase
MTSRSRIVIYLASPMIAALLYGGLFVWQRAGASQEQGLVSVASLPGLKERVTVVRDKSGVPHITASDDHDAYFMMGYTHAQDRFFQMDVLRRQGRGRLAELLGAGPDDQILGTDTLLRTLGVGRSAERSLGAYSPQTAALIRAYSDGVNSWLDSNPLPPEYGLLEITEVPRWTPLDSVTIVKLIQFQIAFDTSDLGRTEALLSYQAAGQAAGFDGISLFFSDIFTVAPFAETLTTLPSVEALSSPSARSSMVQSRTIENARRAQGIMSPDVREAARKFKVQYDKSPFLNRDDSGSGSNWWVVAGSRTDTGNAMLANDPHLPLTTPATFYEIHLVVDEGSSPMNVYGVSYAGVPGVFLGQNERISWGGTTSALDVTDFYSESLVIENAIPVATLYQDKIEPLVILPEEFRINQPQNGITDDVTVIAPGDRPSGLSVPPATLVVPRRNNGPLISAAPGGGISVQFAGASATRDLEGIFSLARARNLADFKQSLQLLEVGSLNWAYADIEGNIAAFVNGKVPLREDLQAGIVDGLPPFFLRDGTGAARNEWLVDGESGAGFNYDSLPFEELPQAINPARGYLVNANNDPLGITFDNDPINQVRGAGIYYISPGFNPGFRAAKITSLLKEQFNDRRCGGKVSFQDMMRIQSNVQMFDAEVFTPYIIHAFNSARGARAPEMLAALARDPAVSEAVWRLSNWDFSAPTGIPEGYDGGDRPDLSQWPSNTEISNSVAATIYTVWRSQILAHTMIATLQRVGLGNVQPGGDRLLVDLRFLLDNFATNRGVGASGLDFFETPGIDAPPEIRRDSLILQSLKEALNLLASEAFADAFRGSTDQRDYRWGKLHRITFGHVFGGLAPQFSIPTAGNFRDLSSALPGLAVDGGFETVDIGPFDVRAASSQAYNFNGGSARRYVGELGGRAIKAAQVIPGGESGVVGNRFHTDQLSSWLSNEFHGVFISRGEIQSHQFSRSVYLPAD